MDSAAVKTRLASEAVRIENFLSSFIKGETDILAAAPKGLLAAMEYSLMAGGKRLRPALCLAFARLCGGNDEAAMPFAASIECIHSYSLVHDDLPAMDDDDLRRGKPSCHRQFDEATAILAGDGLLTDAFALMVSCGKTIPAERVLAATAVMAECAGSPGMVGGQFLDVGFTGLKDLDLARLRAVHAMKTGALIRGACLGGAILAGGGEAEQRAADAYGRALGAAFQIADDILDEVGDAAVLGKPVGSDAALGKVTYVSLLGLEKSRELAAAEKDKAVAALLPYMEKSEGPFLKGLASYVVDRVQ
ncbi:polyprenyl synthetase family protein [Desulfovibrio sp. OttesenSCG-928-I05]|nr:polyprenyl synthetase family protein [Desulfovibrio sp. OttesenSCG-928-I05]